MDSPGKNAGVGSHSLLQGIFPIQGLNLHCRQSLDYLSYQESPTTHIPHHLQKQVPQQLQVLCLKGSPWAVHPLGRKGALVTA